jgi:nicotinamide mononucleotide transporter
VQWIEWLAALSWVRWLEIVAAILSAISVYLSAKENIWSWPTGIVSVAMYAVVFPKVGFYADALLQVYFFVISIYGWYEWLYGGEHRTVLHISRATPRFWLLATPLAVVCWLGLGFLMARIPGASLPFVDSALATVSVIAQFMMTRKKLENWLLWIAVDVVYVPMYLYKSLYATALLYAVFLVLATMGYVGWRRRYKRGSAITPHPAPTPA